MHVTFEPSPALDPQLRRLVVQRVNRAVQGFSLAVRQVHVHLSEPFVQALSGAKRCWIQLGLADSVIALGVAQAPEWGAAIDRSLARAFRTVPEIQRRHRHRLRSVREGIRSRLSGGRTSPSFAH